MKLEANLEILNNLAHGFRKNPPAYSHLSLAKDQNSSKYYLIINNTKKPVADKFRLSNNIDRIFCKFVNEGKATIVLKEPNLTLIIQKANVLNLKSFLKIIHLANSNASNISDELNKIKQSITETSATSTSANEQIKKPISTITLKSRKEYLKNFKTIISQNIQLKTTLKNNGHAVCGLTNITLNNCELKRIDPCLFELPELLNLNLSGNKFTQIDDLNFMKLVELNLSNNQIISIGKNINLPRLINLDLSHNKITRIDRNFCSNFKNISKLDINSNQLKYVDCYFGHYLFRLKNLNGCDNQLNYLPFSLSQMRFEKLELTNNPFQNQSKTNDSDFKKFPKLVELCARTVVDKRIKYTIRDIPRTLFHYLDTSNRCSCGKSCFEYCFTVINLFDQNRIAQACTYITINGNPTPDTMLPLQIHLCSIRCYLKSVKFRVI